MEADARTQAAVVEMLNRIYEEIRALEGALGLTVGKGDYRPRIEYFHDAVRALTRGHPSAREAGGRLSLEFLAYDVGMLRYIQSMPMTPLNAQHNHSPRTEVVPHGSLPAGVARKPSRMDKQTLAEAYRRYMILFCALLKPAADDDYRDRVEELNERAEQVATLLAEAEKLGQGKGGEAAFKNALAHCEDAEARKRAEAMLHKQNYKHPKTLAEGLNGLKGRLGTLDRAIAGIEAAHMQYATAQLGIYEAGKDMVKKLAGQGLNLAGRFVEAAAAEAQRERGR